MKSVTIGCDPEFMIIGENNHIVRSSALCIDPDNKNHFGEEMGQNGRVFELRPDPSHNVFEVLGNIRRILYAHIEDIPTLKKYNFIAGHAIVDKDEFGDIYYATGGHIHIEVPDKDYYTLRKLLDRIINDGFMWVINDREHHRHRKYKKYGKRNHFTHRLSCTKTTIVQYKTPPSWLVNPTLAFMFLALAKICGLLFVNRKTWDIENTLIDIGMVFPPYNCKGRKLLKELCRIVKGQTEMMTEGDVALCISIIEKLPLRVPTLNWQRDFKPAWGL